jgi:hypothetical protein
LTNNVNDYIVTATGGTPELNGEVDLQFDATRQTLIQNASFLTGSPYAAFVSNLDYRVLANTAPSDYPTADPYYTGETINALALGPNVTTATQISRGQLCRWRFDSTANNWGFELITGGTTDSTAMLAIAVSDILDGNTGTFLLKGFISTTYADLGGSPVDGEPLYIQRSSSPFGKITNAASWAGTSGTDIYRCIGYLVASPANTGAANITVIRFNPSTEYLI